MFRFLQSAGLATAVAMLPQAATAQTAPATGPGLIDAEELMDVRDRPGTVILHVGGSEEGWRTGRIPGSRYLPVESFTRSEGAYGEPGSIRMDLPFDLETVRGALAARGVSDATERIVVAYPSAREFTLATRAIWTLEVLGLGDRAFLLDGGLEAWTGAEGAIAGEEGPSFTAYDTDPTDPDRAITAEPNRDRVVSLGWMTQKLGTEGLAVVDARSTASYTGEREEFPGRAGHIPGAGSLPIERLLGDDGTFLGGDVVSDLLREAGVRDGDRVVTYCHIGQRASAAWFAATLAGYDAAIYDGSMNEWGRTTLPLETGSGNR